MTIMANLEISNWVGIVNFYIINDQQSKKPCSADISWFNAFVSHIIKKSDEMIEVQLHFGPGDADNDKSWQLYFDDMVKTSDVDITSEIIVKNAGKSQIAWRRYGANPHKSSKHIRSLVNAEIIGILEHAFPAVFAKLCNLESAETRQLVAILSNPTKTQSIPGKFKKAANPAPLAVAKKRRAEPAIGYEKKNRVEPATDTHIVPVLVPSMVSVHEFTQYKREMNMRFSGLEQMMTTLRRTVESFCQNRTQVAANVAVAIRNVVNDRKTELFDKIRLITEGIAPDSKVYDKMWPGVRDGNITFAGISNISRCLRYMHTCEDAVLCKSSTFDKVVDGKTYYFHTVSADRVPLAIMEVDKTMKSFVRSNRSVLPIKKAYSAWRMYTTCDACVAQLKSLHFVEHNGGFRKPGGDKKETSPIWEMCSICFLKPSHGKRFGDICPSCPSCLTNNNKNGNTDGGDDRSYVIEPVFYRFPWLTFSSNQDKRFSHLFTATNIAGGNLDNEAHLRGPDTVFFVSIPEVNKKIWILLEEDGNQHNDTKYTTEGEIGRVHRIVNTLLDNDKDKERGDLVFMIRYVPLGTCKSVSGLEYNLEKGIRLIFVRMWVCWFIKHVLSDNPISKATVLYLFYDFDNRHLKQALKEIKSGEFAVGYTYTFPQETEPASKTPPTLYDWRYCVHPQEGMLVNELAPKHNLLFVKSRETFS